MRIEPNPEITTVIFSEEDKINKVMVMGESIFEFAMSEIWHISKVSVTENRKMLTITIKRNEGGARMDGE